MKSWITQFLYARRTCAQLVIVCGLVGTVSPAATGVVNLDPNNAFTSSEALDINNAGQIVGYGHDGVSAHAVMWTVSGSTVSRRLLTGGGIAWGINQAGAIVGSGSEPGTAVYWANADADPIPLPARSADDDVFAFAINDGGVVVGKSVDSLGVAYPVAWRVDADGAVFGPIDLGGLGLASDVNNVDDVGLADVVGESRMVVQGKTVTRAARWTLAVPEGGGLSVLAVEDLGALSGGLSSTAFAVTDSGDICGWSSKADAGKAAFSIRGNGPMTALPKVRGELFSEAYALNDTYVVGRSATSTYPVAIATSWDARRATQLSAKKWALSHVRAINNSGAMVGGGQYNGGPNVRAYLSQ